MSVDIHLEKLRGHPKFYKLLEEIAKLHNDKNSDYASAKEPLSNFTRVGKWCKEYKLVTEGNEAEKVCIIYALKQLDAALALLMKKEKGIVEGRKQRFIDDAVYFLIASILDEEGL